MRTLPLLLAFLTATSGLRALTPIPPPRPLWLGDPGVNVDQARARRRARRDDQFRWELASSLGDYDRIGQKDPRWDADVRAGFEAYAKTLVADPEFAAHTAAAKAAFRRALDAGCQDPLVIYASLRVQHDPEPDDYADTARVYARAEAALERSQYSAYRKLFASVRAADYALKSTWPVDTVNRTRPEAEGTDAVASMGRARLHLAELLHDPAAHADSVLQVAEQLFGVGVYQRRGDRVTSPLLRDFEEGPLHNLDDTAVARSVEGLFWRNYVWHHRSDDSVGEDGETGQDKWDQARRKAWAALHRAYALDPNNARVCVHLLELELDLDGGREEMETWFRRAMDADPDAYGACTAKLEYLNPQWHGSAEAMLKFGHQCVATANWTHWLPCILVVAHNSLARQAMQAMQAMQAKPGSFYLTRPEVREDMEKFFRAAEAAQPGSARYRSMHAYYEYSTWRWKEAAELFDQLGDKPDLEAMGIGQQQKFNQQNYDSMRRDAAKFSKLAPGQPAVRTGP